MAMSFCGHPGAFDAARRRLSNVSDVVFRKISRTIGWRSPSVSVELTVSQGMALCVLYIRSRLKRSILSNSRQVLNHLPTVQLASGGDVVDEVFPVLEAFAKELEKMFPELYVRVDRQIKRGPFISEQRVYDALILISRESLKLNKCSWFKIAGLYAVAGAIGFDCVNQGKPELLPVIPRAMATVLEVCLVPWIQANGGWNDLLKYRVPPKKYTWQTIAMIFIVGVVVVCLVYFALIYFSMI